tara:strand:- start:462 stop:1499 length:1038 start_codon:yes stop_codon:yes gene_type:complete
LNIGKLKNKKKKRKVKQMSSSEKTMQTAVQSTFEQHHNEIRRRSEITQQGYVDNKSFTKVSDSNSYVFVNEDQRFIVFSISQTEFSPVSENPQNPAVCIYGAFPTRDEAVEYAKNCVLEEHKGISVFVDDTHKWVAAVKNPGCMQESYVKSHTDRLLKQHQAMLHTNLKEFQENVEEKKTGETKKKDEEDEKNEKVDEKQEKPKGKSHRISGKLDVRGQKLCVVSFLKDDAEIPEFLFRVYGFFDKEDDANAYVRNICGDKVEEFDIDVIETCQWAFPQTMTYDKANKEVFRSEELDLIMKNHRNQPKEVARFNEVMAKDNEETQTEEMTADTSTSGTSIEDIVT